MPDQTDTQTPPLPTPGAPHAYIAVRRTHSPHADRPEWHHRAKVIPAWDADDLAYARRCGDTLLPIGPDGDAGTRAIVEEFRPAEVEPGLSVHGIIARATRTATTSIKNDNGDSVYSRGNVAEAIRLLVTAIRELDRLSDGE